jgi:transposase-like protein
MGIKSVRTYENEFKNNAVALYKEGGRSYQAVADSLGIPSATLMAESYIPP